MQKNLMVLWSELFPTEQGRKMYRVIKYFTDLHDDDHPYNAGDEFPRKGIKVSNDRLKELAGSDNKQKTPLIEKISEPEPPKEEQKKPVAKKATKKKTTEG